MAMWMWQWAQEERPKNCLESQMAPTGTASSPCVPLSRTLVWSAIRGAPGCKMVLFKSWCLLLTRTRERLWRPDVIKANDVFSLRCVLSLSLPRMADSGKPHRKELKSLPMAMKN